MQFQGVSGMIYKLRQSKNNTATAQQRTYLQRVVAKVTTMVNNSNPYLSRISDLPSPPPVDDADRKDRHIRDSPIWDLDELIAIALRDPENGTVRMVTDKADRNYEQLLENGFDLDDALQQLAKRPRFRSAFWCKTSPSKDDRGQPRGTGVWIPCDAYEVECGFVHPHTGYSGTVKYYLKMCRGLDGCAVLFVSLHV